MYEANGKPYTLEEVKDYYRNHSFLIYNDKNFYKWLEEQTVFKEVEIEVKKFRASTGLSQSKFAEYFGIPVRTLQEWEQGRRNPPEYLLELLKRIWKLESH